MSYSLPHLLADCTVRPRTCHEASGLRRWCESAERLAVV